MSAIPGVTVAHSASGLSGLFRCSGVAFAARELDSLAGQASARRRRSIAGFMAVLRRFGWLDGWSLDVG